MKKLTSYLSKVKDSIVPFMAFLFVYLFDIVYLLRRGRRMLDSDMASEMVLSKLLNTVGFFNLNVNAYISTAFLHLLTNLHQYQICQHD